MCGDQHRIAWVDVIEPGRATGDLAEAYDAVKSPDGRVENLYLAMSQTPRAIEPANDHYLAVLHNPDNPLEPWLTEFVSTYVAVLCGCEYAVACHGTNFRVHLGDPGKADRMLTALRTGNWDSVLEGEALLAALRYARKLSMEPARIGLADIELLRAAGYCDKGISYLVQLVASFAYWARMINALGTQSDDTGGLTNADIGTGKDG